MMACLSDVCGQGAAQGLTNMLPLNLTSSLSLDQRPRHYSLSHISVQALKKARHTPYIM